MSSHNPGLTLLQAEEFALQAQEICHGITVEILRTDWRLAAALERKLECLGEAVKRLPAELRDRYLEVPWRKVTGMRDYLCHGYDTIEHQVLFDAVQVHLPLLLTTVARMRRDLGALS